ncbi:MAG: hypothetical protein NTY66_02605 [Candidatus Vogelbacteria bacterium]|nr:hypothetical protein [Candidatus Vogelbacteria bacterium]
MEKLDFLAGLVVVAMIMVIATWDLWLRAKIRSWIAKIRQKNGSD